MRISPKISIPLVAVLMTYAIGVSFVAFVESRPVVDTAYRPKAQKRPGKQLVYYAAYDQTVKLAPLDVVPEDASPLPEAFVIATGVYTFEGRAYGLDEEGLFRFVDYWGDVQQRVVFRNDVEAFVSAISWATVHGLRDVYFHKIDWKAQLKIRKLSLACWNVSLLTKKLLAEQGIKARIVSAFTQEAPNNFDDGHALIEVYRKDLRKWVAYDLDNNVIPTAGGERLSALQILDRIRTGQSIDFETLSSDPLYDASDLNFAGFDASFYADRMASGTGAIRDFYDRVFQAIVIYDGNRETSPVFSEEIDPKFRKYISSLGGEYTWLSRQAFTERLYGLQEG